MPVSFAVSAANTTTADASKNELKNLQLNIAEKEKSVKEQQGKRANLLTQLKNQEKDIAAAGRELYSTQKTLKQLDSEITTLSAEIKQLDAKQKAQRALLSKQLDAAFRQGRHQGIELIFKGEEGQRDERILAYYTYIGAAREKPLQSWKRPRSSCTPAARPSSKNAQSIKACSANSRLKRKSWIVPRPPGNPP